MASTYTSIKFPGFELVHCLGEPGDSESFRVNMSVSVEEAFGITRGEIQLNRSISARWTMGGSAPADVIRTTMAIPYIVHDRVVDILGQFTGWSTYPVEVYGKLEARVGGYRGLSINGRCGPIDKTKSQPIMKKFPARMSKAWRGLFFDPSTWDGTDLFMPHGNNGWIFVVDEVRRAFERAKVENVTFTALDQIEQLTLL
jgi:hypothetical protein